MTMIVLSVVGVITLTGGIVGCRVFAGHPVLGFFLGAFIALILCDIAIRLTIGKSLSLHITQFADKLRDARTPVPKVQP